MGSFVYHEFAVDERMTVVQWEWTSRRGTYMGTTNSLNKNSRKLEFSTYNTNGDLIFSANRVKLTLFQALARQYSVILLSQQYQFELTGVTDVNMHGWLPNSSSYTVSYQPFHDILCKSMRWYKVQANIPTPNPSPFIGFLRSTLRRELNAWLIIEWHGLVRSCISWWEIEHQQLYRQVKHAAHMWELHRLCALIYEKTTHRFELYVRYEGWSMRLWTAALTYSHSRAGTVWHPESSRTSCRHYT